MGIRPFLCWLSLISTIATEHQFLRSTLDHVSNSTFANSSILHLDARSSHVIFVPSAQNNFVCYHDPADPGNIFTANLGQQILFVLSHDSNTLQSNTFLVVVNMSLTQTELRTYTYNFSQFTTQIVFNSPDIFKSAINLDSPFEFIYSHQDLTATGGCITNSLSGEVCFSMPLKQLEYAENSKVYLLYSDNHLEITEPDLNFSASYSSLPPSANLALSTSADEFFIFEDGMLYIHDALTQALLSTVDFSPSEIKGVKKCHDILFLSVEMGLATQLIAYNMIGNTEIGRLDLGVDALSEVACRNYPQISVATYGGRFHVVEIQASAETPPEIGTAESIFDSQEFQVAVNATGNAFSVVSSVSVMRNILDQMYGMFQDFWFYKYHAEIYPEFVRLFTEEMDLLNLIKIKPTFFESFPVLNEFEENARAYNNISKIHKRAPEDKYFLSVTKNVYTYNFVLSTFGFGVLSAVFKCIAHWKNKKGIKGGLYNFIDRHTMWWNLIIMLIDGNIMFTTFSGFVQLINPGCLNFKDKVNMTITILYLFVNMIFPFVLYPFVFSYSKKSRGEIVLTYAKFTRRGFLMEIMIGCIRSFFRGAVHAFFLKEYAVQLFCLTISDLILILICILLRKGFMNKGMLGAYLLYYVVFLAFDFLLLNRKKKFFRLSEPQNEQYLSYAIFIILGSTGLKILAIIFEEVREIVKGCQKGNKIHDQAALKAKGKKKSSETEQNDNSKQKQPEKQKPKSKSKSKKKNIKLSRDKEKKDDSGSKDIKTKRQMKQNPSKQKNQNPPKQKKEIPVIRSETHKIDEARKEEIRRENIRRNQIMPMDCSSVEEDQPKQKPVFPEQRRQNRAMKKLK